MSGLTNWSEALAHPCFWALHYSPLLLNNGLDMDKLETFFECSAEQNDEFFRLLHGDEDFHTPLPPDTEYEDIPASVLRLSFPENYTWALEFGGDGLVHQIYHPQEPLEDLPIAVDGGNALLPGLRWAEVKQMVACLQPTWPGTFDLQALYPLLYPIADPVTLVEYDEVRQTLGTAWEALQMVKPSQLEEWLDISIRLYEKGRILRYDAAHGWQDPHPSSNVNEEKLWLPDHAGDWFCTSRSSMRRYGSHDIFTPFFDMLERHTQPHT